MRRFRRRRRRLAAAALLPLAAILTTSALAQPGAAPRSARIDTSARSVAYGDSIALRGEFPGARRAPIELRYRAHGSRSWHTAARARTGNGGHYDVRVRPRRSALWRAELARASSASGRGAARLDGVDADTAARRVTVRSRTHARVRGGQARVGDRVKVKGKVLPAGARRRVVVHVGHRTLATRAGRDGRFSTSLRVGHTGTYGVRVRARANADARGSGDRAGRVVVYRSAVASWYGPGLYGGALACGGRLSPSTMGVAHKTLPCGTKVHLRYGHRTVTVPVIDRGPYVGGREFDLTAATRSALGFPDVGTVLTTR